MNKHFKLIIFFTLIALSTSALTWGTFSSKDLEEYRWLIFDKFGMGRGTGKY